MTRLTAIFLAAALASLIIDRVWRKLAGYPTPTMIGFYLSSLLYFMLAVFFSSYLLSWFILLRIAVAVFGGYLLWKIADAVVIVVRNLFMK